MSFQLNKVLISDNISYQCVDILKSNGIEVELNTKLTKEQLLEEIPKYDGLIVRSATKVTAEVLSAATNLKVIGRAGTGVDNIDCVEATKRGILVMNTPTGNSLSAAELTCCMVCCLSRRIPQATISMRSGKWERSKFMGNELSGKTLAIIGLGRIGKEVATRMQAFEMTCIGYDPITPAEVAASWGVTWMPLEEIWTKADYITVHTPLIPQTANLISAESLAKCKKGVKIINCARGGIVDEAALLDSLNAGHCGGAALDVFVDEPPKNLDLVRHDLVISTPHLGASTEEAQVRVAKEIAYQFVDLRSGKGLVGAVNGQALTQALSPETEPWKNLCITLGRMISVLSPESREIRVNATGDLFSKATYLEAGIAVGFLPATIKSAPTDLNLISAPAIAKEHRVNIKVNKEAGDSPKISVSTAQDDADVLTGSVCGSTILLTSYSGSQLSSPLTLTKGNYLIITKQSLEEASNHLVAHTTAGILISYSTVTDNNNMHFFLLDQLPCNLTKERIVFAI